MPKKVLSNNPIILNPCSDCGGTPFGCLRMQYPDMWEITCESCGEFVTAATMKRAVKRWNKNNPREEK